MVLTIAIHFRLRRFWRFDLIFTELMIMANHQHGNDVLVVQISMKEGTEEMLPKMKLLSLELLQV